MARVRRLLISAVLAIITIAIVGYIMIGNSFRGPTTTDVQVSTALPTMAASGSGLGVTRENIQTLLSKSGMQFKAGSDLQGLKRTQGSKPRSLDAAELVGPDDGLVYIFLSFDAKTLDAVGPAMGDKYLGPVTEAIGDPELASWCRSHITEFKSAMKKDEIYTTKETINGREVGIQAMMATPGALVSCWVGSLPE